MSAAFAHALPIPAPRHDDDDGIRTALQVAARCWEQDDPHEALRFLKRAAREAADGERVDRALGLSKAVAELAASLDEEGDSPRRSTVIPSARALSPGQVPGPPPLPRLTPRPRLASIPPVPSAHLEEAPLPLARQAPSPLEALFDDLEDDDGDEPTVVRHVRTPQLDDAPSPVGLTATRVAVFVDQQRGMLQVRPLASDEAAPRGAPVAMLVAPSRHDAERLAALLRQLPRR